MRRDAKSTLRGNNSKAASFSNSSQLFDAEFPKPLSNTSETPPTRKLEITGLQKKLSGNGSASALKCTPAEGKCAVVSRMQ